MTRLFASLILLAGACSGFVSQKPSTSIGFASQIRQPTFLSESSDAEGGEAKVVLVTGSSRGLGKAIALELGKAGQKVVINYVSDSSKESADATIKEIEEAGGEGFAVQADTSDPDAIAEMFKAATEKFGTVDVLINNAGITKDTLVMRMKPEQWQSVIDVNLSGVFYCTQAFFKLAAKKRTGRIINISSVVGQIGNPGQANYAAAKGGVIGMTYANAKEFAARGVTVNAVCPGYIESDMTAVLSEDFLAKMAEVIPLKRLGKPEEVAGLCKYLALDSSANYITGHTFNVDGGIAIGA
mmetsp:Transcript_18387/g.50201  ORF Transcript_18387/g.50201 Transcript_18387/m.50201 type:complete len:298 (-) Transcript_18387:2210-3103(-)